MTVSASFSSSSARFVARVLSVDDGIDEDLVILQNATGTSSTEAQGGGDDFDPRVFWGVNAFIALMVILGCTLFWYRWNRHGITMPSEQDRRLEDARRAEERRVTKLDNPIKRKRKLLQSFRRCQVTKVRFLLRLSWTCHWSLGSFYAPTSSPISYSLFFQWMAYDWMNLSDCSGRRFHSKCRP